MKNKEKKKIKIFEDNIISLETIVISTKLISLALVTINIVYLILTIGYSVFSTKTIFSNSFEDILKDEMTVNYLLKINDYSSLSDIQDAIEMDAGKVSFYMFEVVLPTIIIISVFILSIVLGKKLNDFINNVKSDADIFTSKKIEELKKIRNMILDICILLFLKFNLTFLIFYALLDFMLEIIIYLFSNCVKKENKQAKIEN